MKRIIIAIVVLFIFVACKNNQTNPLGTKEIDAQKLFKENIEKVIELCKQEAAQDLYDLNLAGYTFYDIDSDGIDELYIRDTLADCGWLFCCGADSIQFVASENYKLHFYQLGNIIMLSGSAGTGTFYAGYFDIEKSKYIGPDFFELNEFVWGTEDSTRTVFHPLNDFDGDYPQEKTRSFFDKIEQLKKNRERTILSEAKNFAPLSELKGVQKL